jgi:hypothetical protein
VGVGATALLDNLRVLLVAAIIAGHGIVGYADVEFWRDAEIRGTTLSDASTIGLLAVVGLAPTRSTMPFTGTSSAASNTIPARCANPARTDDNRVYDSNTRRSAAGISTAIVNAMTHDPNDPNRWSIYLI